MRPSKSAGALPKGRAKPTICTVSPGVTFARASAPADFEGRIVVDYREPPTLLGIGWGTSGTTAPFLSMGANGLVLDLDNASIGARHALLVGMRQVDLLTLPTSPTLAGGRPALALTANGSFDAASTTLHATHIAVHFAGP